MQLHRWVGLAVGLFFLLSCVSGAILVFEKELDPLIYRNHYRHLSSPEGAALPLDALIHMARAYAAPSPLKQMSISADFPEQSNLIFVTEGGRLERTSLALHPVTGQLVSRIQGNRHLFTFTEEFHRRLLMDSLGKKITGLLCLAYMLILMTGLVIWWPKNKKVMKQRLKIKWDASRKRLNWDIHAVGGFYALPLLLLMCLTALTWSYKSFENGIYYLFDGTPKPKEEKISLKKVSSDGNAFIYQNIYNHALRISGKNQPISITVDERHDGLIHLNIDDDEYFFNASTAKIHSRTILADQSTGTRVRNYMEPLHTGSEFGFIGKSVYLLVVLFGAALPVTGFYIWLGRKKKKKKPILARQQSVC